MDAQGNECRDYRAGVCQKGCGLILLRKDSVHGKHCCLNALRAQNGVLQANAAKLELEAKKQRLKFALREQFLLARVSSLQNAALAYQNKFRHMVHINITKQLVTGSYTGGHDHSLPIAVQRERDSVGFKSRGGTLCQVNGKDLSKVTPEEAVEVFRSARDPIVVQVLRRNPASGSHGNSQEARLVDVCTQTDITFEHIMALSKLRPTTPPLPDLCPFLLSDSCHSLQAVEQEFYEGTEYLVHTPASGERADEFEYEEVELCRLNSQEKLGLTLCYRTDEEEDVGIYVSEVGPNSIAARDGRIREGDRILQINGQDVQNREEAVTALSNEECQNILLLVARPELQLDEGWLDDEQSQFLEELKMEMLEEQRKEEVEHTSSREEQPKGCEEEEEEDEITTDTATCSSNNRYRAGDPDHSSESPEREAPACVQTRPAWGRQVRLGGDPSQDRNRASGERPDQRCATPRGEGEEGEEGHEHFRQHLEVKCQIGGEYDLYYSRRSTVECSLTEQEGVQRELRLLNEELKSIERECQNIMQARQLHLTRDPSKDPGPDGAAKPANVPGLPERSDKDSSSAYNTAESSRSTPLATRRSPDRSLQRAVSTANQKNLLRTAAGQSPQAAVPAKPGPEAPQPVPYLSPNRHANIPAHARHYQSYMHLIQQRAAVEVGQSQLSLVSVCKDLQPRGAAETRAEWKVKLRADGSRYVARRPARDRLLRERALKIREERGGGTTTTDDDAASELKLGRYWSKEERKQHLLRAKEQRRRREFMMRSRLESLRESPQSGGEGGRKEVSILELSHRKMMKKRNRKILDNWMTIQELMSHGARTPEDTGVHSAFLSVTTV